MKSFFVSQDFLIFLAPTTLRICWCLLASPTTLVDASVTSLTHLSTLWECTGKFGKITGSAFAFLLDGRFMNLDSVPINDIRPFPCIPVQRWNGKPPNSLQHLHFGNLRRLFPCFLKDLHCPAANACIRGLQHTAEHCAGVGQVGIALDSRLDNTLYLWWLSLDQGDQWEQVTWTRSELALSLDEKPDDTIKCTMYLTTSLRPLAGVLVLV